ncbi:hypothetical protein SBF1_3420003 [Candidatus Desulfosporosinus infrequens]|uniref:Uncharacterized protein n=1 Tax=Candidatus Desulfosporosinus infrequens TaxID=2043169 RepID=A0A2U3L264_9FIRM|nr:hypothetical protein SBF1_3420003 [Candidatus Desulfosporosinus infrequens]
METYIFKKLNVTFLIKNSIMAISNLQQIYITIINLYYDWRAGNILYIICKYKIHHTKLYRGFLFCNH